MKRIINVFVDTNVIVSSILYPNSLPKLAILKATTEPYRLFTSVYCINELAEVFKKKFPNMLDRMDEFLLYDLDDITVVNTFINSVEEEKLLRDPNDREVLRGAIVSNADILLTGDKDFIDSDISNPKIHNPKSFIEL